MAEATAWQEGGVKEIVKVGKASDAVWCRVSGGVIGGRFSSIWKWTG